MGKTTAARILARALNCEKGPTPEPCNECAHCKEIVNGSSMDVFEIDGASNRGIDEVRQIIENIRYQPAECRFKIYIIDEVHQVTKDAFNALLKTLEEPPPFAKFILATTEPHRLPETILSRCQQFDFRRIPVRDIARRLRQVADDEKLRITESALLLIARQGEGSMRDAQSLLEQVLSYSAPASGTGEAVPEIDEGLLQDILGITERRILYELSEAVIRGDANRCIESLSNVMSHGLELSRLSRELVEHFRNLLVARLVLDQKVQNKSNQPESSLAGSLFDLPDQEVEGLKGQVSETPVTMLMDYFRYMANGDEEVARSPYPRFALEATLVRLATLSTSVPVGEAIARLEGLERKLSEGGTRQAAPVNKVESQEFEETAEIVPSATPSRDDREEVWRNFVAFVKREKKEFLASHLEQVYPLELTQGKMNIGVGERHHLSYLQDFENLSILKTFARRFFSNEVAVTISSLGSEPNVDRKGPGDIAESAGEGEGDKVKVTLEIFGGSIREVKKSADS